MAFTMLMAKREAVAAQIDGALRALEAGDHVCAIALATAAEAAMPPSAETSLREMMTNLGKIFTEAQLRLEPAKLNALRDWLNGYSPEQPDTMRVEEPLTFIIRACGRFQAVYGHENETREMQRFWRADRREFDSES